MCNRIQKTTHGTCKLFWDETLGLERCLDLGSVILYLRPENMAWHDYWLSWQKNAKGQIVGFTLNKITTNPEHEAVYTIDASFGPLAAHWFCDCWSDKYRKPGAPACKHCRSVHAALSAHGLLKLPAAEPRKPVATVELEAL